MTAPIVRVLEHYFEGWEPPAERSGWVPTLCPSHPESRPSAAVNFGKGAVRCHSCGFRGDVISIIREMEGVSFADAQRRAAELSDGSHQPLRGQPERQSGRRVFGRPGTGERAQPVPPWLRR
ncbi:CHC2 zinc finger domain-containing protein [Kitasatospora sp. NPDC056184]|uniref:CHC2 zinc finger domain-containing protein n=1 Tax=Kitasatospora sp. NPDC056184 TaxID=3345738 RepID=UPI0035E3052C